MNSFITGIKNIITWLPIIWKDRNWDYTFLVKIIIKKLELDEQFYRSDNTVIKEWEEVADEMKEVREALQRFIEDDYVTYEEVMNDARKANEKEEKLIAEDLETAFGGMKKNIRKWWD